MDEGVTIRAADDGSEVDAVNRDEVTTDGRDDGNDEEPVVGEAVLLAPRTVDSGAAGGVGADSTGGGTDSTGGGNDSTGGGTDDD